MTMRYSSQTLVLETLKPGVTMKFTVAHLWCYRALSWSSEMELNALSSSWMMMDWAEMLHRGEQVL